jgi:hypothetical protein
MADAVELRAELAESFLSIALWSFWILCTFSVLVTALDLPFPVVFKDAVRLSAARGKTWEIKPSALGPLRVRFLKSALYTNYIDDRHSCHCDL